MNTLHDRMVDQAARQDLPVLSDPLTRLVADKLEADSSALAHSAGKHRSRRAFRAGIAWRVAAYCWLLQIGMTDGKLQISDRGAKC